MQLTFQPQKDQKMILTILRQYNTFLQTGKNLQSLLSRARSIKKETVFIYFFEYECPTQLNKYSITLCLNKPLCCQDKHKSTSKKDTLYSAVNYS